MNISFNRQALVASRALSANEKKLSLSTEKLSSGYRINHAKDDAAGLAISKKMRMQIRGLSQADDNTKNGISVCEIADGALSEIEEMLQRMNELAIKASNGTLTTMDRSAISVEVEELQDEITRISKQTDFNGQVLLDGTYDLHGYSDKLGVKVNSYTDDVPIGEYEIEVVSLGDETTDPKVDAVVNLLGGTGIAGASTFAADAQVQVDGNKVHITDNKGKEIWFTLDPENNPVGKSTLDICGIGAFSVQIGANEGQLLDMRLPEISLETLGIDGIDMMSGKTAKEAIDSVQNSIDKLNNIRSRIGAYQNRLEHTASNLAVSEENMTAAESKIMDLDMSKEMVEYTTRQVLVQAGTSMLTQANQQPEQALQLLS